LENAALSARSYTRRIEEESALDTTNNLTHGLRKDEVWSCRFIWLACFAFLLPVAIVARLSGWRWRPWPAHAAGYGSAFKEAKSMSTRVAGVVFSI
jgi:hypothetical protein